MKDPTKLNATDLLLRQNIQEAILSMARASGNNRPTLVNTDIIDALLDVTAAFAGLHGFENYTPRNLAEKYTRGLANRIEAYKNMPKPPNLKITLRSDLK